MVKVSKPVKGARKAHKSKELIAAEKMAREADVMSDSGWTPKKPGDSISGKIIKLEWEKPGKFGACPYLTLEVPGEGPVAMWASTVLANRLREEECKVGDEVAIAYHGTKTTERGGRPAKIFALVKVAGSK